MTFAPWMCAATAYIPNVGGQTSTASSPGATECAHQKINGFIAAAADEQHLASNVVELGQALDQRPWLRFRVVIEAGERLIVDRAPGEFVGVQPCETGFPSGMLIGLEGHDIRTCECLDPAHGYRSRVATAESDGRARAPRDAA